MNGFSIEIEWFSRSLIAGTRFVLSVVKCFAGHSVKRIRLLDWRRADAGLM